MKKASEYRQHAQECRDLASKMDFEEQRAQLLRMADHWEKLADERVAQVSKSPEPDAEHDEERSWCERPSAPQAPPAL